MKAAQTAFLRIAPKTPPKKNKRKSTADCKVGETVDGTETAKQSVASQPASKKKRKNDTQPYTNASLQRALEAVTLGMPVKTAARMYNIPKTTLLYKKRGTLPPVIKTRGPECILGAKYEQNLVEWILHMSRSGFLISRDQILDSVQLLLKCIKKETQFTNNRPGRHWYDAFRNRHPELSERMSQNMTRSRAAVTEGKLRVWFSNVQNYFESKSLLGIDASRVFNCDECAFFLSPKGSTVLARKGGKTVCNFVSNDEKECLTTLVCESASGEIVPPMVVFSYKRIPGHIAAEMPKGWGIGHSECGWMTAETFYEYIANVFYSWLVKNGIVFPIILFLDGYTSYLTMPLSDFCRQKGIEIVALYPNATHILQPLDVAFFHPLEAAWANVVRNWRLENNGQRLKRENFGALFKRAIESLGIKSILKNGFENTGLHPFSVEGINYKKCFKNSGNSETIIPRTQTKVASNTNFLQYMECNIEKKVLEMFRKVEEGADWTGEIVHRSLFYFWRRIKNSI